MGPESILSDPKAGLCTRSSPPAPPLPHCTHTHVSNTGQNGLHLCAWTGSLGQKGKRPLPQGQEEDSRGGVRVQAPPPPPRGGHCLAPTSGHTSACALPEAGVGEAGTTHIALIVHHLDLPGVAELHHRPDGHVELLPGPQVHPDVVSLWVRDSPRPAEQHGAPPPPGAL